MTITARTILQETPVTQSGQSLESTIGNTPLIRLRKIGDGIPRATQVLVKAEQLNPGGSIKDRPALNMIRQAERSGELRPGMTILDATSGNTGIAYAMIGAARGYPITLCLPANARSQRKEILRRHGVEIIETDPLDSTDGAQLQARNLARTDPNKYFYADQYNNPANWRAHYHGTAREIWLQTEGQITHFVAGLGTSGTFVGTVRKLRELNPHLTAISLQPNSPLHGLEGLKHMGTAIVPGIYDPGLADAQIEIATEDAEEMCKQLAAKEGLFVGPSSGANVFAALNLASSLPSGSVVVTILCDRGERYID